MTITSNTYSIICNYFDDFSFEKGGALAIRENKIVGFYPIKNLDTKASCYSPSFDELNVALDVFEKHGWDFFGIIHSHVNGNNKPSKEDVDFIKSFIEANDQFEILVFPIICLKNGSKDIAWYLMDDEEMSKIDVKVEL